MTCNDCIHYDVCQDLRYGDITDCDSKDCGGFFKNKADFVELPCRCSECKYLEIINKEPVYAECKRQKLTFLLWQADTREHFCSYGERVNYESTKND